MRSEKPLERAHSASACCKSLHQQSIHWSVPLFQQSQVCSKHGNRREGCNQNSWQRENPEAKYGCTNQERGILLIYVATVCTLCSSCFRESMADWPQFWWQISIMKMVKHKHVVKLFEVLASRSKVLLHHWAKLDLSVYCRFSLFWSLLLVVNSLTKSSVRAGRRQLKLHAGVWSFTEQLVIKLSFVSQLGSYCFDHPCLVQF